MKQEKLQELEFLKKCNHNDLKLLADCIIYGVGNSIKKPRLAQRLTETKAYNDHQRDSLPNAVEAIVDEFLRCGGSTIANTFRKEGVSYSEIIKDICDRLYIYCDENMPITMVERNLITYLMERCLVSNFNLVDKLYSEWCEKQPIYRTNSGNMEYKMNCILDYCFAKTIDDDGKVISNLKTKIMPFIVDELKILVETDPKDYKGWMNDIYKQANTPSARTELGLINKLHYVNPFALQGAAYDVTFPGVIYIIYMRIKNS